MANITRIFRRHNQDNKHWWHWRADCNIWLAAWAQKRRGGTFSYITKTDGSRPTTFSLCPGCVALDERIRTKEFPNVTPKVVPLTGKNVVVTPQPLTAKSYSTRPSGY